MGTWYTEDHIWNENFTKELDELFHDAPMLDQALSLKAGSSVTAGRVHGNPFIESCNIGRQPSPATMREQMAVYEAAFSSGNDPKAYKKIFMDVAHAYAMADGGHIIDIDDPMLVEQGKAHIHKQFTDYLVEVSQRDDDVGKTIREYMDLAFMNTLASGALPGGVLVEPPQQRFGLPCDEWQGAKVEE